MSNLDKNRATVKEAVNNYKNSRSYFNSYKERAEYERRRAIDRAYTKREESEDRGEISEDENNSFTPSFDLVRREVALREEAKKAKLNNRIRDRVAKLKVKK